MKKPKFTIRDLIAVPFFFVAYVFMIIALAIGSLWTAWVTLKIFGLRD